MSRAHLAHDPVASDVEDSRQTPTLSTGTPLYGALIHNVDNVEVTVGVAVDIHGQPIEANCRLGRLQ
jgi:hypothetical protein